MRQIFSALAVAAIAFSGTTAQAADEGWKSYLEGSKYFGVGLGSVRFSTPSFKPRLTAGILRGGMYVIEGEDDSKLAVAVEAQVGGELFNDPLNESPANKARLGDFYGVWVKPEYRVLDWLVLYGAAGYASTGVDIEGPGGGEFNESGAAYGGGFRLNVSPKGNLNLDIMQYSDEDTFSSGSVSLIYNINLGVDPDDEFGY